MRKLVVAMFMFVCGGSAFAMAQDPVKPQPATEKQKAQRKQQLLSLQRKNLKPKSPRQMPQPKKLRQQKLLLLNKI